ncbi:hypothetical protein C1645_870951 [Glomus cerebriforme]|uniref:F-box domain-containing protein n=1 Tax=Glomus cerebriforme TaxID=658196 RepID=A0A397TT37_9GLOM|nr:hypothetical protein C1645_870951 [Glomus cerebriforme]
MSKLHKDILFLMFEVLQDDSKSLFSCLIVNRLWCETAISILWRNPWRYDIGYHNKRSLYSVITYYLSDDIKEFLTKEGTEGILISRQSFLFDYLSFCRSINIDVINSIISIGTFSAYNRFLLQQEIYSLLMRKCSEIKYFDMLSIEHQIFCFPEAKARLESLCELKCDTSINPTYFHGLARICQNIQRLTIINKNIKINNGTVKLIEVQENLKHFEWKDDFEDDYTIEDPYNEFLLALEQKADTLKHLIICFQYVDGFEHTLLQEVLIKFHKLKSLIINDFVYFNENQLKKLVYPDLEILNIDSISIDMACSIIENSGRHLKEILLFKNYEFFEIDFDEVTLDYIHKIYKHCPSIEYLSLVFSSTKEHFTEFEKLLKVCQNLKSLLLIIFTSDLEIHLETGEELLKTLIKSAPTNLREIRFLKSDITFSLENLEVFLENWRCGRPALSMLTNDPIYNKDDYVKLITKYKNDGVIKDFRFDDERRIHFERYEI